MGVGGVVLLCGGIVNKNEARSFFFRGGEREVGSGSLSLYFSLGRSEGAGTACCTVDNRI